MFARQITIAAVIALAAVGSVRAETIAPTNVNGGSETDYSFFNITQAGTYTFKLAWTSISGTIAKNGATFGAWLYKGDDYFRDISAGVSASGAGAGTVSTTVTFSLADLGTYNWNLAAGSVGKSYSVNGLSASLTPTPVPGPEAGAGLGALAMGGIALYLKRRRKNEALAA